MGNFNPSTYEEIKYKKAIIELVRLNEEKKKLDDKITEFRNDIGAKTKRYLERYGKNEFVVDWQERNGQRKEYSLKYVQAKKIIWNVDKLIQNLDKDMQKRVIDKEYKIVNWQSFVEIMREYNVPVKDIIDTLHVEKTVNEEELIRLADIGDISKKDLKGTYKVEVNNGYVRLNNKTKED